VTYPEIAVMQTSAVIKAALAVKKNHPDWDLVPEIMIPLVGEVKELQYVKKVVVDTADKLIAQSGTDLKYKVGTMIEIPRACVTADAIAQEAEFFSFGTNDLTQMTFGFPRRRGKFLNAYYEKKISSPTRSRGSTRPASDPRQDGRRERPRHEADLKIGICGEHGGDPSSVEF
jgi:pyruvate,orthophosphate dikinase